MKEIEKIIKERRTIHQYLPDKISEDLVLNILRTSYFAPNHKLSFPAKFYQIGINTRKKLLDLSLTIRGERGIEITDQLKKELSERFLSPSHLVAVTKRVSDDPVRSKEDYATISCIIHNISLLLWANGFGSKWTTGDIILRKEIYEYLNINPLEETLEGLVWMGVPKTIKGPPKLPEFDTVFKSLE